ncbi:helix-turn-helix domain-containing protein [Modestobacter sp. NPDC049651]|uniref:helix-turn-helix domain-containing protein n=1 Tax=unclassified Modestobacter TaxID=2643866 RepID=UPI0033FAF845
MADSSTATDTVTDLGKGKRITGDDRNSLAEELRSRYDSGESIRSLATSTNRSYGFVHRLLSESGATLRGRGGANRNSTKKQEV